MKDLHKDKELKENILKYYRIFFFGEDPTRLEYFVEREYLRTKLHKYQLFNSLKVFIILMQAP